ncbi:aminotransferase class IV [Salinirubellus salinus]|uniref:Aminotransferase class IV n=1 Tax=Salinirubellus salinus TaxID=1364945 RepID=A0A9E7R3E9_9EURY|nr:aminotransferase class IV [Salinirubellus salinus]UWM54821.1 aminotransferase class IV [Salinirubellus salinus]
MYHVDGDLVAREDATVSVEDRGFRYGDAAFETMRVYGGTVFEWERHLARLRRTCETLGMPDAVPGDLAARVSETLAANDLREAYCRVSVTRGVQPGKLTPDPEVDPTVVVVVRELPVGGVGGGKSWTDPAVVRSVETRRVPDACLPADAKTHNYLNGILARVELRRAAAEGDGRVADEALMRDTEGFVAEGASSNLFFVDDGTLHTPAAGDLLPGVTREVVLELAAEESFPVEEGRYTVGEVRGADEVFLTNSTWELRPVASVDGVITSDGPITNLLTRLYEGRVEARCY